MKAFTLLVVPLSLLLLLTACKKQETQPQSIANAVVNGDFEATPYQDWSSAVNRNSLVKPNSYSVDYTTEAASSPSHSIKVSCNAAYNDSTYHLLQQNFYMASSSSSPPAGAKVLSIPAGAKLTMKAKIKTVNIKGEGINIAMGGYYGADKKYASAFYTESRGKISINGTNDFTEYTISFDSFPPNVYNMYVIIFFMPNTTGTAYYDDVSLAIN
ncbi:hypothetical protein GO755_13055 [Spirosoma sp. HMF4905]|uniref:DUF4465 domain-containing protein n=1 Tax=Spirosoma arboris TaxID=2682092 RepID=A0A7K1SAU8_9BACT|nr:hypothetical protein [Spirosoma arboris]MVM30963.1 hypothetical protein [Spirosoma arboris]